MKIIYCIDHLRSDGTQHVLRQLITGQAMRGHQQAVLCLNEAGADLEHESLVNCGAMVRVVGRAGLVSGIGLWSAWHWLRQEQFDVAVTFLFASDTLGRLLCHVAGIPQIVSSIRARNVHYRRWQRWLVRWTMRWADAVVLNSAAVREFAVTEEGAPPDRIVVIPNGIEIELYLQPISHVVLCTELGLSSETLLIGSVGRLTSQKGYDVLIEALAQSAFTTAHILLIGVGQEAAQLIALAQQRGIAERVHLLGYRRDVPRLLGALDLYVQPSRFEGMPNAVLEAMAAGCPIVASAVDGIQELIEDGVHGWLVLPEDTTALVSAIDSALANQDEALRRATRAQHRAAKCFSVEAMVAAWEKVVRGDA